MAHRPTAGRWLTLFLVVLGGLAPVAARAEDYVIGPEDVIAVSVWLHPEMDRTLTVNADGNITLPPLGELKAAGSSAAQLGTRLADRFSAYLRTTTTVTVTVTQFVSRSVYVTGAVAKPGRYGFERIPTLLEVIGQAGGAVPGADLAHAQLVRTEGVARRTIPVDLAAALRTGDAHGLPDLRMGDTILIPGAVAGAPGVVIDAAAVLGETVKPGLYSVGEGQDLWALLAAAGGLTARGDLRDVRLLTRTDSGQSAQTVNLQDGLLRGLHPTVLVHPGDVVVVMPRGAGVWSDLTTFLGVSRDLLNIVLVVDYFRNQAKK